MGPVRIRLSLDKQDNAVMEVALYAIVDSVVYQIIVSILPYVHQSLVVLVILLLEWDAVRDFIVTGSMMYVSTVLVRVKGPVVVLHSLVAIIWHVSTAHARVRKLVPPVIHMVWIFLVVMAFVVC